MRHSVLDIYLSEEKIHPRVVTEKLEKWYISLWDRLKDSSFTWESRICPTCKANFSETAFRRLGFKYERCTRCGTLFLSPLPDKEKLNILIPESQDYLKELSETKLENYRRLKVYDQREDWLELNLGRINKEKLDIAVLNNSYDDILKGLDKKSIRWKIQGLRVDQLNKARNLTNGFDVVILIDVLEHTPGIQELFLTIIKMLRKGGKCFITTRSSSGMDIQILGGKSDTIFPLHHINLISVEGLKYITNIFHFNIIELSTPGLLDLQILRKSFLKNQGEGTPEFLKYIFTHRSKHLYENYQKFLQENLLSSHLRAILERK